MVLFASVTQAYAGFDCYKGGMVSGLTDIDQMSMRPCSGDLYGLEDGKGRVILPTKYSDIEYCGHGIFLATEVQKANKYYFGAKRHFFNRDGIELNYTLPVNASLFDIFSFGDKADRDPNLVLSKFSSDTLLLFGFPGGRENGSLVQSHQGLCKLTGQMLMRPIRGVILFIEPGSAFIVRDGGSRSILNLKTMSDIPTKTERSPGVFPMRRIPQPDYGFGIPFPKDRVRKVLSTDKGAFDKDYWCERRNYPINAEEMFNRFLHDYDLIDMQRNKVISLLGPPAVNFPNWMKSPETLIYLFPNEGCLRFFFGIRIYLKNDQVTGWTFVRDGMQKDSSAESKRISNNVVLQRFKHGRIGEVQMAADNWPVIEAKSH